MIQAKKIEQCGIFTLIDNEIDIAPVMSEAGLRFINDFTYIMLKSNLDQIAEYCRYGKFKIHNQDASVVTELVDESYRLLSEIDGKFEYDSTYIGYSMEDDE